MNDTTTSLTRRYARPVRVYVSFTMYDMLAAIEPAPPSAGSESHLRLVVSNDTSPKLFSPHYHTGD